MSFEYFIGGRYLRARQKQAFISLITILSTAGVMVGVMALIVVIAVMSGFESDLKTRILGGQAQVVIMRQGGAFTDYRRVVTYAESVDAQRNRSEQRRQGHQDAGEHLLARRKCRGKPFRKRRFRDTPHRTGKRIGPKSGGGERGYGLFDLTPGNAVTHRARPGHEAVSGDRLFRIRHV
jgi:hypothetical protein